MISMRALAARMARLSIREAIECPLPDRVDRARRDLCLLTNSSGLRTTAELARLLRHLVEHNGYDIAENLIPEYERCVREAAPGWFLMENVPEAPAPAVESYRVHSLLLNNRQFGGEQNRDRRFSFGSRCGLSLHPRTVALESFRWAPAVVASGGARPVPVSIGGSGKRKRTAARNLGFKTSGYLAEAARLQGLPDDFDLPPFTVAAKVKAVGNGVPYPMARAIAVAVREALHGAASNDARRARDPADDHPLEWGLR